MATSAQIKQLVETSSALSEAERIEWLDLLPYMNDKQQSELLLILQPGGSPGSQAVTPPLAPVAFAPSGSSAVAHSSVVSLGPDSLPMGGGVRPVAQPPAATTVSAFLHKNFASELHHGSIPGTFKPEVVNPTLAQIDKTPLPMSAPPMTEPELQHPVLAPQPTVPSPPLFGVIPEQKVAAETKIIVSAAAPERGGLPVSAAGLSPGDAVPPELIEPVISAQSLEAVRMLNVATLRAKGVMSIETELKALCGKFGYFSVQFAFEQSPVYQAYIAVGARILKDHQTFEEAQAALASAGRPYLTKPEFEEFSDLLRRLKGHA